MPNIDVFISHAFHDYSFVQQLRAKLELYDLKVWMDSRELAPGDSLLPEIEKAIQVRSKNIYGPYERKVVLAQGKPAVNGPHQGALVDTASGEWWFLQFQDKGPYGRVVHLQPTVWKAGFPVMDIDKDGDGTGEPVMTFKKPNLGTLPIITPPDSDEFNANTLGLQWQWHGNSKPEWAFPFPTRGVLRNELGPIA